jgi:DNA-binding MarR family transcriptional regulator
MTTELTDREYQALAGFRHALRVFLRFSEEHARAAGLTPNQHQLLLAVRGHPGPDPPSTKDLADRLQLRNHSVVELLDRAEAAGLVRRDKDPADRRRQLVTITPTGRQLLGQLSAVHRDELRRFRRELNALLDELG